MRLRLFARWQILSIYSFVAVSLSYIVIVLIQLVIIVNLSRCFYCFVGFYYCLLFLLCLSKCTCCANFIKTL